MVRSSALFAGVLGAWVIAGCASSPSPAATSTAAATPAVYGPAVPPAAPPTNVERGFNVADVVFLQEMIGHHQVALQVAGLAEAHSSTPQVRQIASTIES